MNNIITVGGVKSELTLEQLRNSYFNALRSYNEALKISNESNSEEFDVELARAEAEVETLAYVLNGLGISLQKNIDPDLRKAIIELLTVEAVGQVKENIEDKDFSYLSSLISGKGATPLVQLSDDALIFELRAVFGKPEDFSPLEHTNVDAPLISETTKDCFSEMRELLVDFMERDSMREQNLKVKESLFFMLLPQVVDLT